MRKALFLLLLLCRLLRGLENIPYEQIAYGGEPASLVGGCVHAITGDYVAREVDWVVQGHEPIVIERRHLSSRADGHKWAGWEYFFNHLKAFVYIVDERSEKDHDDWTNFEVCEAVIPEKYGFSLSYEGEFLKGMPEGRLKLKGEYPHALTNCHTGEVGARKSCFSNHVYFESHSVFKVHSPDGSVRVYQRFGYDKESYYLRWERLPNGNKVHYQWQEVSGTQRLKRVATTDGGVTKTYAWIDIRYVMHGKWLDRIEIQTSDQQQLVYDIANKKGIKKTFWAVQEVKNSGKPTIRYDYWGNKKTTYFLCDRFLPEGRRLRIDYYLKGDNLLSQKNVHVKKKTDKIVMRVKRLRLPLLANGALQSIYEFYYRKPGSYRKKGGFTDVVDPYGNATRYHFNSDFLLKEVDHQEKGKGTFAKECFEWTDYDSETGHWLRSKTLIDGFGTPLRKIQYSYDKKGNVYKETLIGDLEGRGNNGETYSVERLYNQANLVTEEKFPNGKRVEYHYVTNTNLIHKKLTFDRNALKIREFFLYEGTVLRQKIIDDGTTGNPADLTGVSERRILNIIPRQQSPFIGFPDCVEEKYYDFDTGSEQLLGRQVFEYTPFGKPKKVAYFDACGQKRFTIESTYDEKGRLISETDPLGRIKTVQYDSNDNPILDHSPDQQLATERSFDIANRLKTESHGKRQSRYEYDFLSRKTTDVHFRGTSTWYHHDPFGHPIKMQQSAVCNEGGEVKHPIVNRVYNSLGRIAQEKDAEGNLTQTTYTCRGKPKWIRHPDGTEEHFRYNIEGELILHIAPGGAKTRYSRDFLGRTLVKRVISKEGECLSQEAFEYNAFHLLKYTAPDGTQTTYRYDGAGRKIEEQTLDRVQTIKYDSLGREERVIQGNERAFLKSYDLLGRVLEEREEDLLGKVYGSTRYTYDDYSNKVAVIKEVQVGDSIEKTEYDPYKRVVCMIDPMGNETHIQYEDFYRNRWGQNVLLKTTTNPKGVQTVEEYDALDRLVKLEKHGPDHTFLLCEEFFYDLNGNKKREESTLNTGDKIVKEWVYDSRNRVIQLIEGQDKTTTYSYTPDGHLQTLVKPDGNGIHYTYDGLGRQTSIRTSDGSCHYGLSYDAMGNIIESRDLVHNRITLRKYDHFGNLLSETLANGLSIERRFDAFDRRTLLVLPDQSSITYQYDPYHLLAVTRESRAHTYDAYDKSHNLLQETLMSGGEIQHQVDLCSRRIESATSYSLERIPEIDPNGNVLSYYREAEGNEEYSTFDYDFLDQLTCETGTFENHYAYDSHYNRLQKNEEAYTHDCLHQLLSTSHSTFDHDLNGNRTLHRTPSVEITYHYDGLDRLIQIRSGEKAIHFCYDSWGRCIQQIRSVNGVALQTTPYLFEERNEIGAYPIELRILGQGRGAEIGATVAIEKNNQLYIPTHDLFGNIIALLDTHNLPIESYRFSSFGEEATPPSPLSPWRYQSKRHTAQLVHFGRRFYDPATGRWLSPDPKGFSEGPNLYQYLRNSPHLHLDLYGLSVEENRTTFQNLHDAGYALYYSVRATIEGYGKLEPSNMNIKTHFYQALTNLQNGERKSPIDHSHSFIIEGKVHPEIEYVLLNGIRTTKEEAYEMGQTLSAELNGAQVKMIYNNTHGFLDIVDFFCEKFGHQTSISKMAYREIKEVLDRGKRAGVQIHSEGHAIYNSSAHMYTQEEKDRLEVYGFGSVDPIPRKSGAIVNNYISGNDLVSFFASPIRSVFFKAANLDHIHYLEPHSANPLEEHSFHGKTYTKARREVCDQFNEKYRN